MDDGAGLIRCGPERIEVGGVEHAADAARQGRDHRAGEARRERRLQHGAGARTVLQRHARERHETPLAPRRGELGVVEEAAPRLAFRRRQLVAEPVRPTSDHVTVDPLLVHPSETPSHVAQAFHNGPRRLAAGKGDRQARAILDQAQRGEAPALLANCGKKVGRHEMAVNVDDHFGASTVFDLSRAAAIMSASCAILIGRLFTTIPSGRTASLTALAIAAGAPR
jgi:hypothetical protein